MEKERKKNEILIRDAHFVRSKHSPPGLCALFVHSLSIYDSSICLKFIAVCVYTLKFEMKMFFSFLSAI